MASKAGRVVAAIMGVAVALASTSCSVRAQMAYSIDGVVTTIDQVSTMYDSCLVATSGTEYTENVQARVWEMIMADLARLVAADEGVEYSEEALRQSLTSGELGGKQVQVMMNDQKCSELATGLALYALIGYKVGGETYASDISAYKVAVNPRFGTWNPAKPALQGTGSLSKADDSSAG